MSHQVFISYSSHDWEIAFRVCRALEKAGVRCWIARRNIAAGADWAGEITQAIDAAEAMVLVFSGNADNSDQIKKELVLAGNANKVVIPARVENLLPTNPAFRYELATRHWIDLFDNWQNGIDRIVDRISSQQARPIAPVPIAGPSDKATIDPTAEAAPVQAAGWSRSKMAAAGSVAAILLTAGVVFFVPSKSGQRPADVPKTQPVTAAATEKKNEEPMKAAASPVSSTFDGKYRGTVEVTPSPFIPSAKPYQTVVTVEAEGIVVRGELSYRNCDRLPFLGLVDEQGKVEMAPPSPAPSLCPFQTSEVRGEFTPGGLEIAFSIVRDGVRVARIQGLLTRRLLTFKKPSQPAP